jgi:hypothetical protein
MKPLASENVRDVDPDVLLVLEVAAREVINVGSSVGG